LPMKMSEETPRSAIAFMAAPFLSGFLDLDRAICVVRSVLRAV
jgi:hypothetical protein